MPYWIDKFGLPIGKEDLLQMYEDEIEPYPEVQEALDMLGENYELIVTSNAAREFIEIELEGLEDYFQETFSATSDFMEVKKSPLIYGAVCARMAVKPFEMLHIGDHYHYDYESPLQAGLEALFGPQGRAHRTRGGGRPARGGGADRRMHMKKNTRLILALDVTGRKRAISLARELNGFFDAIKVGYPLILNSGLAIVSEISAFSPVIADLKVADIPNTSRLICDTVLDAGASAVIAQAFPGRDSLLACAKSASARFRPFCGH